MINTQNLNEAWKQIQKLKKENREIIVKAQDPEFNRKILENKDVDILLGVETHNRKDYLKQRDSGLNEVLCKLAKNNNIKIGIDVDRISGLVKIEKARVLARVIQNIGLCKRIGCEMTVYPKNYKKQDVIGFFLSLGSDTKTAKKSL